MAPVAAFCASSAIVRLGFSIGEVWAVLYEDIQGIWSIFVEPTSLFLMCLVALSLIPLVRSEGDIIHVTTAPATQNDTEEICDAVIVEFKLSKREGEILKLVARKARTSRRKGREEVTGSGEDGEAPCRAPLLC